jgi:hypothetical protein
MRYPHLRTTVPRYQSRITYQGLRREAEHHSHAGAWESGFRDPAPGYRGTRCRYAQGLLLRRGLGAHRQPQHPAQFARSAKGQTSESLCAREISARVEDEVVRESAIADLSGGGKVTFPEVRRIW